MAMRDFSFKKIKWSWRGAVAGLLTGLANGLFGAGGGMVAVFVLEKLCGMPVKKAHASAIGIILPLSAVTGAIYAAKGSVDYHALLFVAPALTAGSLLGAKLTGRINEAWMNRLFSLLMLAAGVWLVL